jgi:hypothetical protein
VYPKGPASTKEPRGYSGEQLNPVAFITMDDAACRSTTTTGAIGHTTGVTLAYQWTSDRTCDLLSATVLDRGIPAGMVNVKP